MSHEDDTTKAAIASLGNVGTDRAGMLAMELQRGMDRYLGRESEVYTEVDVPPNDTIPATIDQYLFWLEGFVAKGGRPTHSYDYPWRAERWLYASMDFAVNGECGARSVKVIVETGAAVLNPNPWKPFGGYGHNELFLMDGFKAVGNVVSVYSNPEFDPYRPMVREP